MKKTKLLVKNLYCNGCVDLIKKDIIREFGFEAEVITIKRTSHDEHDITIENRKRINEIDMLKVLHRRGVELLNFEEKNIKKANS